MAQILKEHLLLLERVQVYPFPSIYMVSHPSVTPVPVLNSAVPDTLVHRHRCKHAKKKLVLVFICLFCFV